MTVKVAIATEHKQVAGHFGHCPEFTLFDIEDGAVANREVLPNPGHRPGFLPGYLGERGIDAIIAGGMGQRAIDLFESQGITPIVGVQGDLDMVAQAYIDGTLETDESLCTHDHEGQDHHHHHSHH